jgi:serine/threonine protein kinase
MDLSDSVLRHLQEVVERPDLSATRFELAEELGRGGAGIVYAAHDRDLNRRVALKVMEPSLHDEAPLIARLEHPAIVPVYERGTLPDGRIWYAMKLVDGTRLDRYAPRLLSERLRVFHRIGEAVAYAHSCGIPHRDLKPQNIMVGSFGEVYVMDWGVPAVAGTPAWRAPEPHLDERSDIYALGALLLFLAGDSAPPALRAIAAKAMHAEPASRYPTATALLADVERFEDGFAVTAWREPLWHRTRRFAARNAVLLVLLAAFVAVKAALYLARNYF